MRFELTPEQDELQRSARGFVERRLPVAHLRALRDGKDPLRLSRAMWRELAGLGWAGIAIPEAHGGAGLGLVEVGLVMEELGRTLAPTPMLSTAVLGATALAGAPELLPSVAAGDRIVACALEEDRHFAPYLCAATARRTDAGWVVSGTKAFVLDGPAADTFVVLARVGGAPTDREGLALFVVERAAAVVTPLALVDSRSAATVRFSDSPARPLGAPGAAGDLLDELLQRGTAALCAEMLGAAEAVFATTLQYLKDRRQFGVPIGSFQALKHRAAHLFCELELTRSVVRAAVHAVAHAAPDAATLVSAAKARASDTFVGVSAEAIQMHGGIGVTDDLDVGFYYKRARTAAMTFGAAAYHRDRFARLQGY